VARWRKVDTRIWGDAKVRRLTPNEKLLWVFLLTHPQQTCIGAFRAHADSIAKELGLSAGKNPSIGYRQTFKQLVESGLITIDEEAPLIILNNFLRYNKLNGPNNIKAAVFCFDELPECPAKVVLGERLLEAITIGNPNPTKHIRSMCEWASDHLLGTSQEDNRRDCYRDGDGDGDGDGEYETSSDEEVSCSEAKQVRSEQQLVPPQLEGFSLYREDPNLCRRLPALLPVWTRTYRGVDVLAEIAKAQAWELANPERQKTPRGRVRFLNGWLSRAQDRARAAARGGAAAGASTLDRMLAIVEGKQAGPAPEVSQ
jgi:hypothetical protein